MEHFGRRHMLTNKKVFLFVIYFVSLVYAQNTFDYLPNQFGKLATLDAIAEIVGNKIVKEMQETKGIDNVPADCYELLELGHNTSGIYTIYPRNDFNGDELRPFKVYCDMETDGGGWLVFQRRKDGSVDFYLRWDAYKKGFGYLQGEFWLGNDKIHQITRNQVYELRVELEDFNNFTRAFAKYGNFSVGPEAEWYKLNVGDYQGTAGDAMAYHNGFYFSTKDEEHHRSSKNCAKEFSGAWWYNTCHNANLNGRYLFGDHASYADGVNWKQFKGHYHSLKFTEMKIRPKYVNSARRAV